MNFRKSLAIALITLTAIPFWVTNVVAVDEEVTPSVISDENQEEIDALREEVQKKVKEKLSTILNSEKKKGWVGVIEEKGETSFELKNQSGARTATISSDISIVSEDRKAIEFSALRVGQRIIAMGYEQIDGTLEAKRIVVTPEPKERKIKVIFGIISDKSEEEELISISKEGEKEYELILNKKTIIGQRSEMKVKLAYKNLKADQKIIAIVTPAKSNGTTFDVSQILILSEVKEEKPTPTLTKED